jgi:hypothetical protein
MMFVVIRPYGRLGLHKCGYMGQFTVWKWVKTSHWEIKNFR